LGYLCIATVKMSITMARSRAPREVLPKGGS
jgi:hypothetical protein